MLALTEHLATIGITRLGAVGSVLVLAHAAVTNEGNRLDAKPALALHHLCSHGVRSVGMTGKHCAGDRRPRLVAESADAKLRLPFCPSALVAPGGQGVLGSFHVAPGHIRQK